MPFFGGGYWGGGTVTGTPSGTDTNTADPSVLYCDDEDIAIHLGNDYGALCPRESSLAGGTDGVFAGSARWTLTSATSSFTGVRARGVVLLGPEPKAQFGRISTGVAFAVNSVATGSLLLRRLGSPLGYGEPPAPAAGLTSVRFAVPTFRPQIADASDEANRRWGVNEVTGRTADQLSPTSLADLRTWCVLTVARWAYTMAPKAEGSDFAMKLGMIASRLEKIESRLQLLWGPKGDSNSPTRPFAPAGTGSASARSDLRVLGPPA